MDAQIDIRYGKPSWKKYIGIQIYKFNLYSAKKEKKNYKRKEKKG